MGRSGRFVYGCRLVRHLSIVVYPWVASLMFSVLGVGDPLRRRQGHVVEHRVSYGSLCGGFGFLQFAVAFASRVTRPLQRRARTEKNLALRLAELDYYALHGPRPINL